MSCMVLLASASNSDPVDPSWCLCINKVHEKCHVWLFRLHLLQGRIVVFSKCTCNVTSQNGITKFNSKSSSCAYCYTVALRPWA